MTCDNCELQLLPEEMERLKQVQAGWDESTRLSRLCLIDREPKSERIRLKPRRVAIRDEQGLCDSEYWGHLHTEL